MGNAARIELAAMQARIETLEAHIAEYLTEFDSDKDSGDVGLWLDAHWIPTARKLTGKRAA